MKGGEDGDQIEGLIMQISGRTAERAQWRRGGETQGCVGVSRCCSNAYSSTVL